MRKLFFFVLSFFLVSASFAFGADIGKISVEQFDIPDFIGYVPTEIVVKFDPSIITKMDKAKAPKGLMGIASLDQVGVSYKTISILPQFPKAKKKIYRGKIIDLSGWHKIKFSEKVDVETVIKKYKNIPGVIDAQPIGVHTLLSSIPNDPYFNRDWYWNQWHLNQVNGPDIDAPEAWDIETGSENIIVAILDSGVRYFHKDLGGSAASYDNPDNTDGNIWINWTEKNGTSGEDDDNNGYTDDWVGYDFVHDASLTNMSYSCFIGFDGEIEDCEDEDNDPRDFNGHGTHVAGIVAAITNNGYGTSSTAGGLGDGSLQTLGNGVKIMPLRICWSAKYASAREIGLCRMDFAAEALVYAADNGARFVSASWSSDDTGGIPEAINYFLSNGGIIFKAAGNDSSQSADYINSRTDSGIISVSATDSNDCKADFSTYGDWVDISAPGVDILSIYHRHVTPADDFVQFLSGTSMASPLALSVAALIWSQNPDWQADQVVQKLYESTDDIYGLSCNSSFFGKLGVGRVNALNAVNITCLDSDGDEFSACDGDCDDTAADINPGAAEVCDGKDNNCDGQVDEGVINTYYQDSDVDTYGDPTSSIESCSAPEGYVENNTDCDDNNPDVNHGATEVCNGIDDDCNGKIDENLQVYTFYYDSDGDGYGNPYNSIEACSAPLGYTTSYNDCDDSKSGVNPGAAEVCDDSIDNDCDDKNDCSDSDCSNNPICQTTCNNNGTCEQGEDCHTCLDCIGEFTGKPSKRYCCGNGVCEGVEDGDNCGIDCSPLSPVCGNHVCENGENSSSCSDDCPPIICTNKGQPCEDRDECCSKKCFKGFCK